MSYPTSNANLNTSFAGSSAQSGVHAPHHDALATEVNAIEADLLPGGALRATIDGKAPAVHTHAEADVTSLTADLGAKLAAAGGTASAPTISDFENLTDQGADPASPAAGAHRVFSKAGGLYVKNSAGVVVGPLAAAGTGKFRYGPGFPTPQAGDDAPEALVDVATTSVSFQAKRTGGTGAVVDLLRNGVSILSAPLSLTGTTWMAASFVAAPNLAAGDTLQAIATSVTGGVSLISTSYVGTQ